MVRNIFKKRVEASDRDMPPEEYVIDMFRFAEEGGTNRNLALSVLLSEPDTNWDIHSARLKIDVGDGRQVEIPVPLHIYAAGFDNLDAVKILHAEHGFDLNEAIKFSNAMFEGGDVNFIPGYTIAHMFAHSTNLEGFKYLKEHGANLDPVSLKRFPAFKAISPLDIVLCEYSNLLLLRDYRREYMENHKKMDPKVDVKPGINVVPGMGIVPTATVRIMAEVDPYEIQDIDGQIRRAERCLEVLLSENPVVTRKMNVFVDGEKWHASPLYNRHMSTIEISAYDLALKCWNLDMPDWLMEMFTQARDVEIANQPWNRFKTSFSFPAIG